MSYVYVEELDLTPEEICRVIGDHVAYHDIARQQREEERAIKEAQYQRGKRAKAFLNYFNEQLQVEAQKEALLKVINERLQAEAQKAEAERLQQEREQDPLVRKVRDYWNQSLAPKIRQFNIAA